MTLKQIRWNIIGPTKLEKVIGSHKVYDTLKLEELIRNSLKGFVVNCWLETTGYKGLNSWLGHCYAVCTNEVYDIKMSS